MSACTGVIIRKPKKKRGFSVTVCIAAIYQNSHLICISDRMITSGDIEFEQSNSKIISLTNSIVVMTAGDGNLQEQLLAVARTFVDKKIKADPKKWIQVVDVANLYRDTFIKLRKDSIERYILSQYGLTYDTLYKSAEELVG